MKGSEILIRNGVVGFPADLDFLGNEQRFRGLYTVYN